MTDASIAAQARAADLAKVRQARVMMAAQRVMSGPRLCGTFSSQIRTNREKQFPSN
jgi:hypothetical protein